MDFYIFVPLTVIFFTCLYGYNTPYILWLKSQPAKYSIPMVNNLGTVSSVVAVVSATAVSYYTDLSGSRWEAAVLAGVVCLFSNIVLTVWNVPYGLHFFAYIALGAAHGIGSLLVTWTGEALADDLETRSIVFAIQNTFGEVAGLVVPLVAWQVSHAPTFQGRFIWVCALYSYMTYHLLPCTKPKLIDRLI
jgi:MFS transporter, ACS family, pantothenate transporter